MQAFRALQEQTGTSQEETDRTRVDMEQDDTAGGTPRNTEEESESERDDRIAEEIMESQQSEPLIQLTSKTVENIPQDVEQVVTPKADTSWTAENQTGQRSAMVPTAAVTVDGSLIVDIEEIT
jgi:hypothetical protein